MAIPQRFLVAILGAGVFCLFLFGMGAAAFGQAAYIRGSSNPWGNTGNQAAMDAVFGAGQWDEFQYSVVSVGTVFSTSPRNYNVIFMEGGDSTATQMSNFIAANVSAIEDWVTAGGGLLSNSAPNTGGSFSMGFGVTLNYNGGSGSVTASDPNHWIFTSGSFTPIATSYTGNNYTHATVSGANLDPILNHTGSPTQYSLAEMPYGNGVAMFGGMTTINWHSPQPQAENFRRTLLEYLDFMTAAPIITTPSPGSLGTLTEGQTGWSETFECVSGVGPYDWTLSGAPGWMQFNPVTGSTVALESATVGAAGSYTFDVTVTDANAQTGTETYSLDVSAPPVISGPGAYDPITEGGNWPAPVTFSVSGGTGTPTWSATGLPAGMTLNASSGVLDGPVDPATSGGSPYAITVTVEDANGVQDVFGPMDLTVNPTPIVTSNVLPLAPLTLAYSTFLQGTGGTTPYTWAISGNSGPFTVDPGTGEITGTPLTVASYTFDATLTDASGVTATGQVTIDTGEPPVITPPMLPELTVTGAVPADTLIEATGGFPAQYVWTHTGTLPSGLDLTQVTLRSGDVAYQLGGTAQFGTVGTHTIDVTVEDTFQTLTDTVAVTIQINPAPSIDTTGGLALAPATITGAYAAPFTVVAGTGTGPYTWSFDNVTGPVADLDGFAFVDGDLTSASVFGPPGDYTFAVTVTDKNGVTDMETFTLTINPAPVFADIPYAREGKVYTATLAVEEGTGTAPFVYTIITNLPIITELSVDLVDGIPTITGTPPKASSGTYSIELNAVDANGVSITQTITFVITAGTSGGCCGVVDSASPGTLWLLLLVLLPVAIVSQRRLHT